jgi:hypothetical protein
MPEPKTVKYRAHLELHMHDLDGEIEGWKCSAQGAYGRSSSRRNGRIETLFFATPEGNEFCLGADGGRPGPPLVVTNYDDLMKETRLVDCVGF